MAEFLTHSKQNQEVTHIKQNGTPMAPKYQISFHWSKSVSRKNTKCLNFVLVQVTPIIKKRQNFSAILAKIEK